MKTGISHARGVIRNAACNVFVGSNMNETGDRIMAKKNMRKKIRIIGLILAAAICFWGCGKEGQTGSYEQTLSGAVQNEDDVKKAEESVSVNEEASFLEENVNSSEDESGSL